MRTLDILLADDHPLFRAGIRLVLEGLDGIRIVAEASRGDEAVEEALRLRPRLVVMDVSMPLMSGLEACRQITRTLPDTVVLMVTASEDPGMPARAAAAGASAFIPKSAAAEEVQTWIGRLRDRPMERPEPTGIREATMTPGTPGPDMDILTERERDVLRLLAAGHTNREIAEALGIGLRTVETHRAHVQEKLGLAGRAALQTFARQQGVIGC